MERETEQRAMDEKTSVEVVQKTSENLNYQKFRQQSRLAFHTQDFGCSLFWAYMRV